MNAQQLTALGTGPLFLFAFHKMSDSALLYVYKIFDHTHSILGSITLIQVMQPVARKPVTSEAIPDLILTSLLTVLDPAQNTGLWFYAVVAPAAGAWILISRISDTEWTVHSTGSDQRRFYLICR